MYLYQWILNMYLLALDIYLIVHVITCTIFTFILLLPSYNTQSWLHDNLMALINVIFCKIITDILILFYYYYFFFLKWTDTNNFLKWVRQTQKFSLNRFCCCCWTSICLQFSLVSFQICGPKNLDFFCIFTKHWYIYQNKEYVWCDLFRWTKLRLISSSGNPLTGPFWKYIIFNIPNVTCQKDGFPHLITYWQKLCQYIIIMEATFLTLCSLELLCYTT